MEPHSKQQSERWLVQEQEFINTFFNEKVPKALAKLGRSGICTPQSCAYFASKVLKTDDLRPVDNQGAASYTLVSPSQQKIVQFRLENLNEEIWGRAHSIYGPLVPTPALVHGFPLPVYVSPVLPGHIHISQQFPDEFPIERQLNTVHDLAQFIARGAFSPRYQYGYPNISWTTTAEDKLMDLASKPNLEHIEPRFARKAEMLTTKLHLLEGLPLVLTHIDLAEVNLLVDPVSGRLTGVLDFDGARFEAFGMCIFGVYEGFFGVMKDSQWTFFDQSAPGMGTKV